ncbi:unnamed protein product, partial [Hymenolepis diminuta]
LRILSLAENRISELTEYIQLSHLQSLLQLSIQGNLCAFNQIPHSRSFILSILPTLNFIDGSQPSQEERSLVELISLYQPNHKEPALIDFLSSLNSEAIRQGESRFLKPSETGRRFANSRAKILKRGISAANELSQNLIKWNTPPKWLQR